MSLPYFEKRLKKILRHLGLLETELGVTFVTDAAIARLNRHYMRKTGPTDVLSFPMDEPRLLGDLVVSLDRAASDAKELKREFNRHLLFLLIHGLLHLLGYDHARKTDWARMRRMENELMKVAL